MAAFHNVCQHRGAAFVTEWSGCGARRFTCSYHNWVYDTTGKLVGVTDRQDFSEEQLAGLHAPAVAAAEWGGWVWVNLMGPDAAPPLDDWIGSDITDDLGRFRMEDMVLLEVLEWDVPVSYKAIVDGFNEIYHAPSLHHMTADWARSARDSTFHVVNDHNYMCFVPRDKHRENWPRTGTITVGRSATTSSRRTRSSTAIPSTSRCSTRSLSMSIARGSCAGS